ncbi:MAG: DUF2721 domain-containing protein [Phycisphaerales bacterium]|nr:DUF2721 domain-containing protein [Phycisphaerales bacterium]
MVSMESLVSAWAVLGVGGAPPDNAIVIGQLATPVVMISAAGLLCLGLFNRLATLVARSRAFANERVLLMRAIASPGPTGASLDCLRLEALEAHSSRVLQRASLLRAALQCLLAGVLAMLASSAAIGLSLVTHAFWSGAFLAFAVGLVAMATGVVFVMKELSQSLRDVKLEDRLLRQFNGMTNSSFDSPPVAGLPAPDTLA